jgi:excisionase family DNA binding protein
LSTNNPHILTADTAAPRILYDRKGAAAQLSISTRSLDYLIANKKLAFRRMGARVLIARTELIRFSRADHFESVLEKAA